MSTFADQDLAHLEVLRDLGVSHRYARKLDVIIPDAVIAYIVATELTGESPAYPQRIEDDGKGLGVLRPGKELAGVVQKQRVRPLLVKGYLYSPAAISSISSSKNSMLSLRATGVMPVVEPFLSCRTVPKS